GLGQVEVVAVMEEMGRALAPPREGCDASGLRVRLARQPRERSHGRELPKSASALFTVEAYDRPRLRPPFQFAPYDLLPNRSSDVRGPDTGRPRPGHRTSAARPRADGGEPTHGRGAGGRVALRAGARRPQHRRQRGADPPSRRGNDAPLRHGAPRWL